MTLPAHMIKTDKPIETTMRLIGRAALLSPKYYPLQWHVRSIAAKMGNDYLSQFRGVYRDLVDNWTYVRDPLGLETVVCDGEGLAKQVWGLKINNGEIVGRRKGFGDCDDITAGIAAAATILGFPSVLRAVGSSPVPTHVHNLLEIPKKGWHSVDCVAERYGIPGMNFLPKGYSQIWSLSGKRCR